MGTPEHINTGCLTAVLQNFSLATLRPLTKSDPPLFCHVTRKIDRPEKGVPDSVGLTSFPWLIVEHKMNEVKEEKPVYCQLANAMSAALHMYKSLATHSAAKHDLPHIPPVVGVTAVGYRVKVWLGYVSKYRGGECHVRCISCPRIYRRRPRPAG
jgi:hypothetical protein